MDKKHKLYLKLNLISLFFVIVSFISVTLAWFVYSGLSTVSTEVAVKAWYIEMEKDDEVVSNNIVISLDEIYPGMETLEEEIKIKNLGDSDAKVSYEIQTIRILDDAKDSYELSNLVTSDYIEDKVSHEYPFHINMDLSKKFIVAKTDESTFKVSISWPLDSGDDALDSEWGNKAYKFKLNEQEKNINDPSYQMRSSIKVDIKLTAEQYIENPEASDIKYRLGNEYLFDVVNNKKCTDESTTCLRTNVIDINNTLGDKTVTLLPKINYEHISGNFNEMQAKYNSYTSSWKVSNRILNINDILLPISKDIKSSVVSKANVSDLVIGNLKYGNRINTVINDTINKQGYFKFLNKFTYFYSTDCYWLNTQYNDLNGFAVNTHDLENMKIYSELKTNTCKIIPVIEVEKIYLN